MRDKTKDYYPPRLKLGASHTSRRAYLKYLEEMEEREKNGETQRILRSVQLRDMPEGMYEEYEYHMNEDHYREF